MVIAVNIHALGYFYSWSLPNTSSGTTPPTFNQQLFKPTHLTGFVALIAADVILVTSLSWMRQRFHGTFKTLHVLGVIVFLIGVRTAASISRLMSAHRTRLTVLHPRAAGDGVPADRDGHLRL